MLNDRSSAASLLATRRSGKPRDMITPGPDQAMMDRILAAACRTPDHGKLAPWRFVIVPQDARNAFAAMLRDAYLADKPDAGRLELEAIDQFAHQAPALVVAISSPARASHIPIWEQELSVGAACMNLILAAHAEGLVAGWLTGWASYSPEVRTSFAEDHERIAGFIFLGTAPAEPQERPRPELSSKVTIWQHQ
ncbi:nitroreductase [Sphingomonas sp. 1P06PA]|uniref:nitroreductase family protein n=1 Tax=Sphingomonas sp. 1P06PA TaxID=554121 RepID=UPI0039A4FCC6